MDLTSIWFLMITKNDCFNLGVLTKPHGLDGEMLLFIDADHPEHYRNLDGFFVERGDRLVPYFVESMRPHGKRFVVQLEGVTHETALQLAGLKTYLPLDQLPVLDDRTFYFHEVMGWSCVDAETGTSLGQVETVRDDGPYPLLVTKTETGAECIVPLPDHIQVQVDREAMRLTVELPPGLLELYLGGDEDED